MDEDIQYGERYPADDKHFELYQKGVELGTWDVEKLIDQAPVEKDRETWEEMNEDEQDQWARLITSFMDGEQEVAQDASRLIQMVDSPYLDANANKEAFYAGLALEEAKHTQFTSWYTESVVPDDVVSRTGKGVRHGVVRNPHTAGSKGFQNLFDRQGLLLEKAANGGDPIDIARATANYNLHVEGIIARGGYFIKNRMSANASLPTWNQGFQFVSTDEGRHITAGMEIIRELLEKEQAGEPEYQGVADAVWDQIKTDLPDIYDLTIHIVEDPGAPENPDPLDADLDKVINRFANIYGGMYQDSIGLPTFDPAEFARLAGDQVDRCKQKIENDDYRQDRERAEERFETAQNRVETASDD
jgi:ribonucleoside-diphosphate reductase beta chain